MRSLAVDRTTLPSRCCFAIIDNGIAAVFWADVGSVIVLPDMFDGIISPVFEGHPHPLTTLANG
jgi:hypothetical protein